ncbi:MAG: PP2C family protein-serine/threonine phosphatase, partial [Acidimicrobiia bacterium]
LLGRFEVIDEDGKPFDWEQLPGRRILAGEMPEEVTMGYRTSGSRHVKWSRVNASPIKNDSGEVVWALNFFLDITDQFALRDRERITNRVSEALSGSMRVAPNLSSLNDIIVPEIASWCGFHILDEFDELIPDAVAFPHSADAQRLFDLVDFAPISLDSDQLHARVLATGKMEHIPKITDEMLQAAEETRDKELVDVLRRLEWRSVLCVPLGVVGDPVGTMTLVRTRADGGFDPAEIALVNEIALRAGVALSNARTFEREHHTAEALRHGLRPDSLSSLMGLDVAARYRPVARQDHVGGDFYDFIRFDEDHGVAFVGDIEGKGVEAAAAVGLVRQTLKTTIALEPDPAVVFKQLNDSLISESHSRMCTVAYVSFDRHDNGFSGLVALAGHPPPLIVRSDGSIEDVGEAAPPAGLFPEIAPSPQKFDLGPGDLMLVYTDGIATAEMTSPETVARFAEGIDSTHPEQFVTTLLDRFLSEVRAPRDDIALLALQVTA